MIPSLLWRAENDLQTKEKHERASDQVLIAYLKMLYEWKKQYSNFACESFTDFSLETGLNHITQK